MMSAASKAPAKKDTRKMVMDVPTTAPALRELVIAGSKILVPIRLRLDFAGNE